MPLHGLRSIAAACLLSTVAILVPPASGSAGELRVAMGGLTFSAPVTSMRESRFQTVVRQKFDFSCGSAAVASLLTYHYERPTTEAAVFMAMYRAGDQAKIRREGFSLLDIKNYLAGLGLRSDGFKMPLEKLAEIGVPAITLINSDGYRHFVLIKGIANGEVVIGDPAFGVKVMPVEAFKAIWVTDIAFLIRDEAQVARANFNHSRDWKVRRRAPVGSALSRDALANFTLFSSIMPNEF